jgi:hypothetical protein
MAYQSAWPSPQGTNVWGSNQGAGAPPRQGMAYVSPWAPEAAASYFTDPLSQPIMQAWSGRMGSLQPGNAPNLGDVEGMFRNAAQPNKYYDLAANSLASMTGDRSGATNQYTPQFAQSVAQRKKELYQEPFSTSEDAALKARYFDSLSANRDDRAQQMAQMLAQRGFGNASGLAADAMTGVENNYQTARAQQQQSLMQYVMDTREKRRDQAVNIAGQLADQGYHDASLAAQNLQSRGSIAGALANLAQAQQQAGLQAAAGIGGLRQQGFENRQLLSQGQLETSMLPYTLQMARLQQMTAALGGDPDPYAMASGVNSQMNAQQAANAQLMAGIFGGVGTAVGGYYGSRPPRQPTSNQSG